KLDDIARIMNPILRGWIQYYGKYNRLAMITYLRQFDMTLVAWAMRKFAKMKRRKWSAINFLYKIRNERPDLFVHWKVNLSGTFLKSRAV
ncbi:MAG TPA: group II intron reverse transcriptase/maturase, partial [Holosporales bacterium]|nr:group II intron reverse transcriptase/maturase [Holosporales bacterium]